MKKGHNLAASLITLLIMAVLILAYFQPQVKLSTLEDFGIIFFIELIAYGISYSSSGKPAGRAILKVLLYSALFAFVLTYIFQPKNDPGFYLTFVYILIVQIAGYSIAFFLV